MAIYICIRNLPICFSQNSKRKRITDLFADIFTSFVQILIKCHCLYLGFQIRQCKAT